MPTLIANPTTLAQIRQNFVELSGRYDLVVDTVNYADNGANFFIQAGNRWLDNRQENPTQTKSYRKDLLVNEATLTFQYARSILEVWATNSAGDRTELTKRNQHYMRENYESKFSDNTSGTPIDWAPLFPMLSYEQKSQTQAAHPDFSYDADDVLFGLNDHQRKILLLPPADQTYTITVFGNFFGRLVDDTDSTFWSRNFPDLLIHAAMLMVEKHYRNTQGVNDMLNAMAPDLKGLDSQLVAEESYGINQILG